MFSFYTDHYRYIKKLPFIGQDKVPSIVYERLKYLGNPSDITHIHNHCSYITYLCKTHVQHVAFVVIQALRRIS